MALRVRRRANSRCFWWGYSDRWHSYTLFRMARDGSAIRQLSWNDVNDWFPAVHNNSEKAVTRLTPGHYPEAERGPNNAWYNAPWPLAEDLFIVAYSRDPLMYEPARHNPDYALGLYVLDATAAECG